VAHRSEPRFLVLHRLRVKGFAEAESVAAGTGLDGATADDLIKRLAGEGMVTHRDGVVSGWLLTPAGRTEHGRLLGDELDTSGAKPVVDDAYRRFLAINDDLLAVCTAWQLRSDGGAQVVNDHSDPDYDREVIDRLAAVDAGAQPIAADLSATLERYGPYGPRLAVALERVASGDHEWFTKPMIDSYHTVWMELHEDLLGTLGIQRGEGG
jgi:hypothetical protein